MLSIDCLQKLLKCKKPKRPNAKMKAKNVSPRTSSLSANIWPLKQLYIVEHPLSSSTMGVIAYMSSILLVSKVFKSEHQTLIPPSSKQKHINTSITTTIHPSTSSLHSQATRTMAPRAYKKIAHAARTIRKKVSGVKKLDKPKPEPKAIPATSSRR